MKTIKSKDKVYRYLLFFTNTYHEKVRVEFSTKQELRDILREVPILKPPVYLFKKAVLLEVRGRNGIAGTIKLMLNLNKSITVVLKSDSEAVKAGFLIRCVGNAYDINPNIIEWQYIAGKGFYLNNKVAKLNKEFKERGF